MEENALSVVLLEGSDVVSDLVEGRLEYQRFLERYDSFYYRCGLDGFDASDAWRSELPRFADFVEFHRQVQDVVDSSYIADEAKDEKAYAAAGRISEKQATERIRELAAQFRLIERISNLREGT
jgi:hypothetical protein